MLPILLCITFNLENMIVSNLQNSGRIESLHPQFKPLFDYVKTHDLLHAELGRIDIDGDDCAHPFGRNGENWLEGY